MAVNKVFKQKEGFEVPEGAQLGLLLNVIHLGVQKNTFQGVTSYKDQVLLTFELPDLTMDDGRPVTQSTRVTNSQGKRSTLTKIVKALNGGKEVKEGVD